MTGAAASRDARDKRPTPPATTARACTVRDATVSAGTSSARPLRRSIHAAKRLLARLVHRQSVGALTGPAAFPLMASALAIA